MAAATASAAAAAAAAATTSCSYSSSSSSSSSSRLFWSSGTVSGSSTRSVECCASSTSNSAAAIGSGSRYRCPVTAPAPSRILLPPQMIPIPTVIEVDGEDEGELTFLDYDDEGDVRAGLKRSSPWLTSQYLSLRMRCSSLMMQEAKDALSRHFKAREATVSVNSMLNSSSSNSATTTATAAAAAAAASGKASRKPGEKKKATDKIERISESFRGGTVDFIRDVVLADEQKGYFEDWPVNSTATP